MGIDVDVKYGGTGSTFFTSMLVIEELAKVDPSVSVLCDVQNTIVSQVIHKYANEDQRRRYFPLLCKDVVRRVKNISRTDLETEQNLYNIYRTIFRLDRSRYPSRNLVLMRLHSKRRLLRTAIIMF